MKLQKIHQSIVNLQLLINSVERNRKEKERTENIFALLHTLVNSEPLYRYD